MANTKKFAVKNGLQSQNIEFLSPNEQNSILLQMLDSDTLSVSGNSGQLFSITDNLTGTIFSVNDISGVPSIEIFDTGKIQLAETFGNVLVGTSVDNGTDKLQVKGTLLHSGLTPTDGTAIDQIKTITKSLTLSTDWQDVGINAADLATGTYMVQLIANDSGSGGSNTNEYYSGIMSWYSGDTDSGVEMPTDEIILHRAGASKEINNTTYSNLYLRTYRTPTDDPLNLKLQIYSNAANASSSNYVFKFRRMI